MHHVATPRSIGHRALLVPAPVSAGRHARLKSGGGLPYRPNLRSGCSAPRAIPILSAIAGKQSLGMVPARPTVPAQDFTKRPILPAPGISKGPSQARPARESLQPPRAPSVTLPAPGISKGPTQARPARESLQPPRTPSATFGGYRGANEAKAQSLRGQASRQSSAGIRPSAAPAPAGKVSAPAGRPAATGKQRWQTGKAGKQDKEDKKGSSR